MRYKVNIIYMLLLVIGFMLMYQTSYAFECEEHWAKEEIDALVDENILILSGDVFDLDNEATIEEICRAIVNILGHEEVEDSLAAVKQLGYVRAETEKNSCMTREEMAIIVSKFFDVEIDTDQVTTFIDDMNIDIWAKGTLAKIQEMGIFIGYPDKSFMPQNNITKAELAMVTARCKDYLANESTISKIGENVSKLEIGFFKYEQDNLIISPIEDSLALDVGDTVTLAASYEGDDWDEHLKVFIENPSIVMFNQELFQIEALNVGTTKMRFYLDDQEVEYTFIVIVK